MPRALPFAYGTDCVRLSLPDQTEVLPIREPHRQASSAAFSRELAACFADRPLDRGRIGVVVADKTRLCQYDRYLPVLTAALRARGVAPEAITFYIAYGTHPAQTDTESAQAYGQTFDRYRFVHHDCADESLFRLLGRTSRGTPVRLRRDICDTDWLITFGAISHHYFAGFGGGRKLVFPGLGQREAIYHNHGLFLDRHKRTLARGCRPGRLDGNPLAEDLAEIEGHRPADIALHALLNSRGEVCRLLVGTGGRVFRQACHCHAQQCEKTVDAPYDLVLASCGGHPKDINFIQAHKALHHAADFVTDGGTLILFARCPDGIGSKTFLPWFELGGRDAAFERLSGAYEGNGGTALAMMEKAERIRIRLVTDLPATLCRKIGAEQWDLARAAEAARRHTEAVAAIPNASLLVRGRGPTGPVPVQVR